ncbi:MAG: DUF2207 domain-containing protein, partial [Candidatus Micrarchaeota archaeon]
MFFFALLLLACFTAAKSFYFPSVRVDYVVNDDASVSVREELTFFFQDSFSFAYRDLPKGDWSYENVQVYEMRGGSKQSVPFTVTDKGSVQQIYWNYNAFFEQRVFVIQYVLKNAVTSYDDAFEFYWKVWGEQWDADVRSLEASVIFPRPLYSGARVWLHPALDANYVLEGDKLAVSARSIPPRTFLEFRVLFNKEALASPVFARAVAGKGYDKVVGEENWNETLYGAASWLWLWPVIVFLVLAAGFYYYYDKYGREPGKTQKRRVHDIPFNDKPWEVEWLLTQKTSERSLVATILDLARRGHLKIEKTEPTGLVFKKDDYRLTRAIGKGERHAFEEWLLGEIFQRKKKTGWLSSEIVSCDSIKISEMAEAHKK